MGSRPPPPPLRRNSAITAATPSAPAVDVVRSGNSRCTTPSMFQNPVIYRLLGQKSIFLPKIPVNGQCAPYGTLSEAPNYFYSTQTNGEDHPQPTTVIQNTVPMEEYASTQQIMKGSVRIRTAGCRNRSLPRV